MVRTVGDMDLIPGIELIFHKPSLVTKKKKRKKKKREKKKSQKPGQLIQSGNLAYTYKRQMH